MIHLNKIFFILFFFFAATSCKENAKDLHPYELNKNIEGKLLERSILSTVSYSDQLGSKKSETIRYSAGVVSAIEYLNRKKQRVENVDYNDLKKESVLIFDIEIVSQHKKIFQSERLKYDKDYTIQYLVGNFLNDIQIEQNKKIIYPNAHQYENNVLNQNRIRVFVFFSGLDLRKKMRVIYRDQLFEGGIINFGLNK